LFDAHQKSSSGNHWAVESEIFWKARGDHGWFAEGAIACVFKKLSEATARWYDAGERVGPNGGVQVISVKVVGVRRKKWGQSKISAEFECASGR
jgi:hypothetical protein